MATTDSNPPPPSYPNLTPEQLALRIRDAVKIDRSVSLHGGMQLTNAALEEEVRTGNPVVAAISAAVLADRQERAL